MRWICPCFVLPALACAGPAPEDEDESGAGHDFADADTDTDTDTDSADGATWSQVDAGGRNTCALDLEAEAGCWGDDQYGHSNPPSRAFEEVAAGYGGCVRTAEGEVECWGGDGLEGDVPAQA